jgi:tetratricopeptide (TPR) repeat protein
MRYTIEQEQLDDSLVYMERAKACDNCKQATLLFLVALRIRESFLGLYHQDTAEVYYDIGWTYYEHGELDDAMIFLQQAWRIAEHVYGEKHGVTLLVLDDLRDVLEENGYEDLGIDIYFSQVSQSRTLSHQAIESAQNGHIQKAIHFSQQALIALPPSKNPNDQLLEAADIRRQLGSLVRKQGDAEGALSYLCQSMLAYQSILGPKHATTKQTRRLVEQVAQREITPIGSVVPAVQNPRWWKRNRSSLSSTSHEVGMQLVSSSRQGTAMRRVSNE